MIIREATLSDITTLCRLLSTVWQATYQGIFPQHFLDNLEDEKWRAGLTERVENNEPFYVAEVEGRVVGMLTFGAARNSEWGEAEIYAINILPEFQGKLIGKRLISFAFLQLEGAKTIYLEVADGNHRAQRFYEKMGFLHLGKTSVRKIADFEFNQLIFQYRFT